MFKNVFLNAPLAQVSIHFIFQMTCGGLDSYASCSKYIPLGLGVVLIQQPAKQQRQEHFHIGETLVPGQRHVKFKKSCFGLGVVIIQKPATRQIRKVMLWLGSGANPAASRAAEARALPHRRDSSA